MSWNDELDGWVAQLMQCKPLGENEVKKLCDKVSENHWPSRWLCVTFGTWYEDHPLFAGVFHGCDHSLVDPMLITIDVGA